MTTKEKLTISELKRQIKGGAFSKQVYGEAKKVMLPSEIDERMYSTLTTEDLKRQLEFLRIERVNISEKLEEKRKMLRSVFEKMKKLDAKIRKIEDRIENRKKN